jgi:hypothetical protein
MKQRFLTLCACAALHAAAAPALAAQQCSAQSPAHSVALLELYTSEGCDSCPAADQFVSGLRAAGVAPEQAVVLSLHVDYWDYIGWKDPFSRRVFTERQHWLSDLAGTRTIYTPEIFIGARELRGGVKGWNTGVPASVKRINQQPARADIHIAIGHLTAGGLPVAVRASAGQAGKLYVALVQDGLASDVKQGENRGRTLRHDFVAREWIAPVPLTAQAAGRNAAALSRTLLVPPGARIKDLSVSAFVQSDQGELLQAFALPACGG